MAHLTSIQTARHGISKQKESCDFWILPGTLQRCVICVIGNKTAESIERERPDPLLHERPDEASVNVGPPDELVVQRLSD